MDITLAFLLEVGDGSAVTDPVKLFAEGLSIGGSCIADVLLW